MAAVVAIVNLPGGLAFCLHVKGRTGQAQPVGGVVGGKVRWKANGVARGIANGIAYPPPQETHRGTALFQGACWTADNAGYRWPCQSRKLQRHSGVRNNDSNACAQRTGMVGAVASGGEWGCFSLNSCPPRGGGLATTVPMAEVRAFPRTEQPFLRGS